MRRQIVLYNKSDCLPVEPDRAAGKILVLDKSVLCGEYVRPEYQLVLCRGIYFKDGLKFRCDFLIDREKCDFCADEVVGVIKPWRVPEWVIERLEQRRRAAIQSALREKTMKQRRCRI